jgi:hypothetical protein
MPGSTRSTIQSDRPLVSSNPRPRYSPIIPNLISSTLPGNSAVIRRVGLRARAWAAAAARR